MDDTISRQAAIDEVKQLYEWHDTVTEDRLIDHLKRLPSAQPERIRGKWIITHDGGLNTAVCSECKYMIGHIVGCEYFRFCPNCGARLEVEDE